MPVAGIDETREWLEIVYGDTPGHLNICSTSDWQGRCFNDTEQALSYIDELNRRKVEGIYLRATTLHGVPQTGRGGDDLSFYLPGLWGDIDIAGPGHKTKATLPPDVTEAMRIVEAAGLPEPSHWIHSGGGLYPWWLLRTPAEITDLEDFRLLSAGWQAALARGAQKLGYHYGSGVGDLSRVLRIPGTINRKAGLERRCTMLEGYAWNGPLYSLDELINAMAATVPEPVTPTPSRLEQRMGHGSADKPGDEFNRTATWEDILIPAGWQWVKRMGSMWYLRRPGKMSGGHSATLSLDKDRLFVFSEEAHPFEPFKLYDKFGAYVALEHGGDFRAAARQLGARGYGSQRASMVLDTSGITASPDAPGVVSVPVPPPSGGQQVGQAPEQAASVDGGKGERLTPITPITTRHQLIANEDRWDVLQNLTMRLKERWDGRRLFSYGGVICERDGIVMRPVNRAALDAITVETCKVVNRKIDKRKGEGEQESFVNALPEARVLEMVLARPKEFTELQKLSQVPFVRPDGTICSAEGYDTATKTFLELDGALAGLEVPQSPTKEQVTQAREMLLQDLLGDFPLHTESDRSNALATLLTPFIRDLTPTSPLAIIDAKEAGSGKNLLADIISILTTGKAAQTLPYTTDDQEQRKVITSAFRSGVSMLLFDEAHTIEGASFARALTSHSYQDRVLGSSALAEFPNNRTWISLGNQVQIRGDMGRRVYRVRLEYQGASPESRSAESFRHPDLRQWATDNRRELVRACLILVRAWFALGRPAAKLPFRMGSFERWQETVAGILHVAGVEGFLENVPQWRSESDYEHQYQVDHLSWLHETYGENGFTSAAVAKLLRLTPDAPNPYDMDDSSQPGYARRLGQCYGRLRDRWMDKFRLTKTDGAGHNNVAKWMIEKREEPDADASP